MFRVVLLTCLTLNLMGQSRTTQNLNHKINDLRFDLFQSKDSVKYYQKWIEMNAANASFFYYNSDELLDVCEFILKQDDSGTKNIVVNNLVLQYTGLGLTLKYLESRLIESKQEFRAVNEYWQSEYGVELKKHVNQSERHLISDPVCSAILATDQAARNYLDFFYQKFEEDSLNSKVVLYVQELHSSAIRQLDSLNFHLLIEVLNTVDLDNRGLSYYDYSNNLSVVIFHHFKGCKPLHIFDDLSSIILLDSILRKLVLKGKFSNRDYAFLADRPFGMECDFPQTYGTHFGGSMGLFAAGLIEPNTVDQRRAEIYLPPLWQDALIYNFELPDGYPLPEEAKKYFPQKK